MKIQRYREFLEIIGDLLKNDEVKKMKNYRQHCDISTFEHSKNVAYICFYICKRFNLDYVSAARAGMLHDLFLYDWRDKRPHEKFTDLHAFSHPKIALENARKVTSLSEKEEDIILKHMWPLTVKLPKYKESYIITVADKCSTLAESWRYLKKKLLKNNRKKSEQC